LSQNPLVLGAKIKSLNLSRQLSYSSRSKIINLPPGFKVGLDLNQTIFSWNGVYHSRANRKAIFNRGMIPNIPENPRGRKTPKRGCKGIFSPAFFQERFQTIERVFAWEDKF